MYNYKARVIKIVDGDTVDLLVDLGFNISAAQRFRIMDIDTPEIWRPSNDLELDHGRKAKSFAKKIMPLNSTVYVRSEKIGIYGRWNGEITLQNGDDFAQVMKDNGYEKKESYSNE